MSNNWHALQVYQLHSETTKLSQFQFCQHFNELRTLKFCRLSSLSTDSLCAIFLQTNKQKLWQGLLYARCFCGKALIRFEWIWTLLSAIWNCSAFISVSLERRDIWISHVPHPLYKFHVRWTLYDWVLQISSCLFRSAATYLFTKNFCNHVWKTYQAEEHVFDNCVRYGSGQWYGNN